MAAEIRITISTSADGGAVKDIEKGLDDVGKAAKDAGGGFSAMKEIGIGALRELGSMGIGFLMDGLKSLGGAVMDGISDAKEAAKINAQTEAVLKSTGNAAGVSAQHVQDYAASLSAAAGKSLFGDSQIQESANLLLTFTNIKDTTLDAATAISVDMAQALGGAPKDAAIQLGKALNDPIKGVSALSRVGVTFSDEQKDMIQAMVESGDVAGAQAVILGELNKEFGGSAAAAAAADGGWAQFNDRLGEAKETIGAAILPLLSILVGFLNDSIMPAVEAAAAAFSAWLANPATQAGLQMIANVIKDQLAAAFTFLTQTAIPALIAGWQAIQPAIQALIPIVMSIIGIFSQAGDSTTAFGGVLLDLGGIWTQLQGFITAALNAIWVVIQAVLAQIMVFWQAHGAEIMAYVQFVWDQIVQIVTLALELLQATIIPLLQGIAAFISSHGAEIQAYLTNTWEIIKNVIAAALVLVKGIITAALQLIKGDFSGAWATIQQMSGQFVQLLWNAIKAGLDNIYIVWQLIWNQVKIFFQGIMDGVVGWVLQTLQGIVNAINGFLGAARSAASGLGDAIVSGISSAISSGASAIIDAAKDAAMAALEAAKDALGIGSPSKVFAAEVGKPMAEGMAVGLAAGAPMVAGAAQYAAGAGLSGAKSTITNRTLTYSPTINNYGGSSDALDMRTASSLAGI